MSKYRKRPVVVEAEQFHPDRLPWPKGVEGTPYYLGWKDLADVQPNEMKHIYSIQTREGVATVRPGDWIITGVEGERYPCADSIFQATYEPVEPQGTHTEAELAALAQPATGQQGAT